MNDGGINDGGINDGGINDGGLRVLMVAPTSFFNDYGGHIRILEETLALQAVGHQISVVTYYMGRDLPGVDIRRTWPLPWHTDYEVGSSRHKLAFDVYLAGAALSNGLRLRPHIIHGHMHEGALIGGVLARLLRVPLVFDFQGSLTAEMVDHNFLNPRGRFYRLAHWLERRIDHLPQAILTSSHRARQQLIEQFHVPPQRVHPLPDCVDMNRFDPGQFSPEAKLALRRQLGIPDGRPIVAYLGLLTDYQGVDHLLRVAAWLKGAGREVHFLIMGYPSVERYQQMARDLGVADCVSLPGRISYDDAPYFLSLGDIAISAKMSSTEGSGKLLNYMALGQPTIVYDSPVHREYLAEWGVYVPPGDEEGLAQAVADLLDDPARRAALGAGLRERAAREYSWRSAAARISALYRELVG
jgi:glycosyltransferase involved in cell wall biosynthesis